MALRFLACVTGNVEQSFTEGVEGLDRTGLGGAESTVKLFR